MFKALGIAMILFACFMFSYLKADELKQKYHNLKQMKKALSMMKSEISFSAKELSETAGEISESLLGDMKDFFKAVSQNLSDNETLDFDGVGGSQRGICTNPFFKPGCGQDHDRLFPAGRQKCPGKLK